MNITSSPHPMKAEFCQYQERNRLLGRVDKIRKSIKNPKTLAIGIICSLGVWQIVLMIQLQLTKDKLKKFPERSIELVTFSSSKLPPSMIKPSRSIDVKINHKNLNKPLKAEKKVKNDDQEKVKGSIVLQSAFRKHKASKKFSSQKKSIIKIQSCVRGVLVKASEHRKKEAIREKRLIISTIEGAFSKAQEPGAKKSAFAKLKAHSYENKLKELETTLEGEEKESFGLDCALFREASKNEALATKFVIAKFRLAHTNEMRIRQEKTKEKDAARNLQLEELKNARLQRKRVLKS